jgi:hypothetical protein
VTWRDGTWEFLARGGLRAVFQGLDSYPGLRGVIRGGLRQFCYSNSPFFRYACKPAMRQACFYASSQRYGDVTKIPANYRVRPRQAAVWRRPHHFSKLGTVDCLASVRPNPALSSPPKCLRTGRPIQWAGPSLIFDAASLWMAKLLLSWDFLRQYYTVSNFEQITAQEFAIFALRPKEN